VHARYEEYRAISRGAILCVGGRGVHIGWTISHLGMIVSLSTRMYSARRRHFGPRNSVFLRAGDHADCQKRAPWYGRIAHCPSSHHENRTMSRNEDNHLRRAGAGPVIASQTTATNAYGCETQIVYMPAREGEIAADDDVKGLVRDRARHHRWQEGNPSAILRAIATEIAMRAMS
jgi:hypothetical protein